MKQRVQLTNDMTGCTLYHNQSEYIRRINSDQAYAQGRIWFPTKRNGITVTHLMQRPPHPVGTSEQIHHLFKKKAAGVQTPYDYIGVYKLSTETSQMNYYRTRLNNYLLMLKPYDRIPVKQPTKVVKISKRSSK